VLEATAHRGKTIIYYKKDIPLRPIVDFLRKIEEKHLVKAVANLKDINIKLDGEIVKIAEIAVKLGAPKEVIKRIMEIAESCPI
jgi:hypothetical protein